MKDNSAFERFPLSNLTPSRTLSLIDVETLLKLLSLGLLVLELTVLLLTLESSTLATMLLMTSLMLTLKSTLLLSIPGEEKMRLDNTESLLRSTSTL
jgi:hypothetical protein